MRRRSFDSQRAERDAADPEMGVPPYRSRQNSCCRRAGATSGMFRPLASRVRPTAGTRSGKLRAGLRPCVILLDLMMPGMDGWDFRHEQVHDRDLRDIPVVVITAAGFSATSVKAQFGDIEFVPKPPPEQELLAAVRRRCGHSVH